MLISVGNTESVMNKYSKDSFSGLLYSKITLDKIPKKSPIEVKKNWISDPSVSIVGVYP